MKKILKLAKDFICYLIEKYFPFVEYINKGKEIIDDVNKIECLCGFKLSIKQKFKQYKQKILTTLSIMIFTAFVTHWLDPLVTAFSSISDIPIMMKLVLTFWLIKTIHELFNHSI